MYGPCYLLAEAEGVVRCIAHEDTGDGFLYVLTDDRAWVRRGRFEVFPTAYAAGRAHGGQVGSRVWRECDEAAMAAASWHSAESNHGETSYFGARRIRDMRGYWLGRLRTARHKAHDGIWTVA